MEFEANYRNQTQNSSKNFVEFFRSFANREIQRNYPILLINLIQVNITYTYLFHRLRS